MGLTDTADIFAVIRAIPGVIRTVRHLSGFVFISSAGEPALKGGGGGAVQTANTTYASSATMRVAASTNTLPRIPTLQTRQLVVKIRPYIDTVAAQATRVREGTHDIVLERGPMACDTAPERLARPLPHAK